MPLNFWMVDLLSSPMVLGMDFLETVSPCVNWVDKTVS